MDSSKNRTVTLSAAEKYASSGMYYSEMLREERPDFDTYREFVAQYIDEL